MFAFHKNKSSTIKIGTRQVNGISVIDISGRITLGEGDVLLRDTIDNLLAKGQKKLLLNLAEVSYIDSAGIGALVGVYTAVRKQSGELQLLKITNRVRTLLQITKLYTVFVVNDDEDEAIRSLNVDSAASLGIAPSTAPRTIPPTVQLPAPTAARLR
jgi:anti-sigma B factor antagonist